MKIEMESTAEIVHVSSIPCRVWTGKTAKGVEVVVFVHRLAVKKTDDQTEFEKELQEQHRPLPPAIDLRQIL